MLASAVWKIVHPRFRFQLFLFFSEQFYRIKAIIDFLVIQTRSIRVEGEKDDHHDRTTITVQI